MKSIIDVKFINTESDPTLREHLIAHSLNWLNTKRSLLFLSSDSTQNVEGQIEKLTHSKEKFKCLLRLSIGEWTWEGAGVSTHADWALQAALFSTKLISSPSEKSHLIVNSFESLKKSA